jgi:hypothetical protein
VTAPPAELTAPPAMQRAPSTIGLMELGFSPVIKTPDPHTGGLATRLVKPALRHPLALVRVRTGLALP